MAIESTNFFSFLQQTRSPIGLVDQYNLSEIYQSDQREALENLLLNPEGLDQIAGLADQGLLKEDIRLIGGLESPVIFSLGLFDEVKPKISLELSTYVRVGDPIGEPGKHSYITGSQSDNIIAIHGGLAAKNIEYNYVDLNGDVKTTSVSTSRESLFNSQANEDAEYTEASFPGLLRVRRRGHFNEIKLGKKLFVEKSGITESPGAVMKIPTYMRTSNNTSPAAVVLEAYATKNSPLEIPIKKLGTISFTIGTGVAQAEAYYFGFEIKRKKDGEAIVSKPNSDFGDENKPKSYTVSFNLNGTIGNNVDCILSIYCTPALITSLDLSGLGLKEDAGKDIGLVGFDQLEEVNLSNNGLQNIPTWLKVNYKTLASLDLGGNAFWNNGPLKYFDWQQSPGKSGSSAGAAPILSATQVLCYSGFRSNANGGAYLTYDGTLDTVRDGAGRLFKQVRLKDTVDDSADPSCDVDESNGFRVFSALKSLTLRSSFFLHNADFSKIFPNLLSLNLNASSDSRNRVVGNPPRIHNNLDSSGMSYSTSNQRLLAGNIRWVGSVPVYTTDTNVQFIGRFKMKAWNTYHATGLRGGICTDQSMVGAKVASSLQDGLEAYSLANPGEYAEAWDGWLNNLESLNIYRTGIAFNIAEGSGLEWKKLKTVSIQYTGSYGTRKKVTYNTGVASGTTAASDILNAPSLTNISAWSSGWAGKLFSIKNAKALKTLTIGYNYWYSYIDSDGSEYVLPSNFVDATKDDPVADHCALESLSLHTILGGGSINLQFRPDEFEKMSNMVKLEIRDSYIFGVFPSFDKNNAKPIDVYLQKNRFYNLENLSTSKNTRFSTIWAPYQGYNRGGALLPDYGAESANKQSKIYNIQFYNSLDSKYSPSWNNDTAKRNKVCFKAMFGAVGTPSSYGITTAERNGVPGEAFTSKNVTGTTTQSSQFLFPTSDNAQLQGYIRVGDKVYDAASGGNFVGIVAQVKNGDGARLILKEPKNFTNKTLYFQRSCQNVTGFFSGCTNLRYVYFQNCSLGARIPEFKGNSGKLERARFQNNLFADYVVGTLANISGQTVGKTGRPRLVEFNVSSNPLTKTSIRNIIYDAFDMAVHHNNNFNKVTINLRNTKADIAAGTLSNYTLAEIFDQGIPGNSGSNPPISAIPDDLLTKFNQMGTGKKYSKINILLN